MKSKKAIRALIALGFCGVGLLLSLAEPYHPRTFRIAVTGCPVVADIAEPAAGGPPKGYVVLLHGLAANKRIMAYLAEGFSEEGLRVFVPDLPGHGRTAGPFSYDRAEQCAESLVHELLTRGLIDPQTTILAGHSLGGAIALRVASRIPVAGVVAISPAPMRPIPGISSEMLPFHGFGALPANSLVMTGAWEPGIIRRGARDLVSSPGDGTSQYLEIPHASHVSILFDPLALRNAENWIAHVLQLKAPTKLPPHWHLFGFLGGFLGTLLLAGPFLRETLQSKKEKGLQTENILAPGKGRVFIECAIVSLGAVGLLAFWNPLRVLHLFQGDYLASFLLILGLALLGLHWKSLRNLFSTVESESATARPLYLTLLAAAVTAFLLHFLVTSWIELTLSETWITLARWARFVPLLVAVLPYHAAEEILVGPATAGTGLWRMVMALLLRLTAWGALVVGLFFLHSGAVLLVLLAPYFGVFCVLQRWGMSVVREVTASAAAAALFGAILLAGFCLVVFPTT
jgi:pimeloyl-ACP methyl ester carboxylesterase